MVTLKDVRSSNIRTAEDWARKPFVAVFAGATSGIGEATLKTIVRYHTRPRIYVFARSDDSIKRLNNDYKSINPEATLIPIKVDLSSMKQTREACKKVLNKELEVNLIFHSAGEITPLAAQTDEGLRSFLACLYYSKILIVRSFLPALKAAAHRTPNGARVVAVAGGSKEGHVYLDDLDGMELPMWAVRGHLSALITLSLQRMALDLPEISFIHYYPGTVRTSLFDGVGGFIGFMRYFANIYFRMGEFLGWPGHLQLDESGERNVFVTSSANFPPRSSGLDQGKTDSGDEVNSAVVGYDGVVGSGVYSLNWDCEPAETKTTTLLREQNNDGTGAKVWQHTVDKIEHIVGPL